MNNLLTFYFHQKDEMEILTFLNKNGIAFKNEYNGKILNNSLDDIGELEHIKNKGIFNSLLSALKIN